LYIPNWHREESLPSLHALMRAYAFAAIVTEVNGSPFATHLPFLLDPQRGAFGTLRAHMARPNPQWRAFDGDREALVMFQGPHAYISPSWYEVQPAVPTWNYAVVHAYGVPRCVDGEALREILLATIETFEAPGVSLSIPDEYFDKMTQGVVGFEIELTRLEGKLKLSQNRSAPDRRGVIDVLGASSHEMERELAGLMEEAEARQSEAN
jgi:transcriptional regulator